MAALNDVCREKKNHPISVSIYYVLACFRCFLSIIILNPNNKPKGVYCYILHLPENETETWRRKSSSSR